MYGSHPVFLQLSPAGKASGVYLRNANGMDIYVGNRTLTYRAIGGILDLFVFSGPHPDAVVQQYTAVVGRPYLPPYWGLGFHQCRYGYHTLSEVQAMVEAYRANGIPLDTAWTDIDYMDRYRDFTWDPQRFPQAQVRAFVDQLHANGQHYVVIVDPGIANAPGYAPYERGRQSGVFIKNRTGGEFVGKVWPGTTVFPDFFHANASAWWQREIAGFTRGVPVDGLWIDMNELSNFCDGQCTAVGDPNNPPYKINNQMRQLPLNTKTLDMDAVHAGAVLEYDAHNLFGLSEAIATRQALEAVRGGRRAFVISRSTFPGSGAHTGHWTGDNHAHWSDLYYSIAGMLNFNLFGIPLVGSDICGFIGTATEELCLRWMQLGAFTPFSRNHNDRGSPPHEAYRWPRVASASRAALTLRYRLLPYYYTLFWQASRTGSTVARPLSFEFPQERRTHEIGTQFLIGPALLLSPVLQAGGACACRGPMRPAGQSRARRRR